jgi:hypothetical protein
VPLGLFPPGISQKHRSQSKASRAFLSEKKYPDWTTCLTDNVILVEISIVGPVIEYCVRVIALRDGQKDDSLPHT